MWHTMSVDDVKRKLRTNLEFGLTESEVQKRRITYGENKLAEKKKNSLLMRFIMQFNDFMIIILLIAAIISAIVSYSDASGDYIDSIIIIAIVVFNAIMGLIQESKAEKSLEALKKMSAPTATVKRDGKIINVASIDLVPGDLLLLEAGNFVPADCRLINSFNLKIEESSLTGETVPVLKNANIILDKNIPVADMINMAFSTTIVINGHAEAIVTNTAMDTKVGKIAKMIIEDESPETPLQKKLRRSWKKSWNCCTNNMFCYICNRNFQKNTCYGNVYDICWACSSCNTRGASCYSYNHAIYWRN